MFICHLFIFNLSLSSSIKMGVLSVRVSGVLTLGFLPRAAVRVRTRLQVFGGARPLTRVVKRGLAWLTFTFTSPRHRAPPRAALPRLSLS